MLRITRSLHKQVVPVALGLLALLVSATNLAACGAGVTSTVAAKPTPTTTGDPQLQSYVKVLTTYYAPLVEDMGAEGVWLFHGFGSLKPDPTTLQPALPLHRPAEVQLLNEAQALHDHLTVAPPPPMQMDDTMLKAASQASVVVYTKLLARIDAQDAQGWIDTRNSDWVTNAKQYCSPINDINAQIVSAGLPITEVFQVTGQCDATPTPTP